MDEKEAAVAVRKARAVAAFQAGYPSSSLQVTLQDNNGKQYVGLVKEGSNQVLNLRPTRVEGDMPTLDSVLDVHLVRGGEDDACPVFMRITRAAFVWETAITGTAAFASIVAASALQRFAPGAGDGGAFQSVTVIAVLLAFVVIAIASYGCLLLVDVGHSPGQARRYGNLRVGFWGAFVLNFICALVLLSVVLQKGFAVIEFVVEIWASSISVLMLYGSNGGDIRPSRIWIAMMLSTFMVWTIFLLDVSSKRDFRASLLALVCAVVVNVVRFAWIVHYAPADKYLVTESMHALVDMYSLAVLKTTRCCSQPSQHPPPPPPPPPLSDEIDCEEYPLS
jgi:hypothetical protein